jgi:hypothetical protein
MSPAAIFQIHLVLGYIPWLLCLAARRTEASGGTIGGDFGLRGLAGALDLPRTAV